MLIIIIIIYKYVIISFIIYNSAEPCEHAVFPCISAFNFSSVLVRFNDA